VVVKVQARTLKPGTRILDLGCVRVTLLELLEDLSYQQLIGVDIRPTASTVPIRYEQAGLDVFRLDAAD
jgi:hypothetical protein